MPPKGGVSPPNWEEILGLTQDKLAWKGPQDYPGRAGGSNGGKTDEIITPEFLERKPMCVQMFCSRICWGRVS